MATIRRVSSKKSAPITRPDPPLVEEHPVLHGDQETLQRWLTHYWQKLRLPESELRLLAMTQDRREFMSWTGKRLRAQVLGCYCYVSYAAKRKRAATEEASTQPAHRHLIFIEPDMQPKSIEVTIAHELIHLADRVNGTPRRHRHHGYDSIAADEAAVTGYELEELRTLLHEETVRREQIRRTRRPLRYIYECPACGKTFPRARRYSKAVSCSTCDKHYNPAFRLRMQNA